MGDFFRTRWASMIFLLALCCLSTVAVEVNRRGLPVRETTNEFAVKLRPGANADAVAREHGYRNLGQVGTLENIFRFEKLHTRSAKKLETHEHVEMVEQQVRRRRFPRLLESISDPQWNHQWHLHGSAISLNVQKVWKELNITGAGVQVAVVDDGLQHSHPDISAHYAMEGSYDINFNKADPTPFGYDGHGTSAAGCAGAIANNGVCGVGSAPNARMAGIRLIAAATTDADEAQGLSYRLDVNDILTSSWGPYDDGNRLEGPGMVLKAAFQQGVTHGRGGKGTIYIWAGGNGRGASDNGNYDGYANNRYTIPIGAIVSDGIYSWYSEPCACLYGVVPSSGGSNGGITTISLNNHCTSTFGGTSAAAPIFAGVAALMLEANPNLTWRDVMHVIAASAVKVKPEDPDWITNGGGFHHNHNYGFGRIDAFETVSMAKSWVNVPPSSPEYHSAQINVGKQFAGTLVEGSITIGAESSEIDFVEHVDIWFQASHHFRGKVEVYLRSPSGTVSVLAQIHGDHTTNYPANGWKFGSVRNWGESIVGTWTVSAKSADESTGTFNWFKLDIYGHKRPAAAQPTTTATTQTTPAAASNTGAPSSSK